ncbi:MAG TPA: TetR/AcrR family transcriptional regulator [Ktedonobacteraceae bacterium]|jgi:AcrR family transcriptional regulator|nr:TetR/AcrR family transcriptional regulator [Ktedonobacteraceae bacterium]
MDMQDRRVKRTQKALAMALVALTLEKGYAAITIRDITDRAEVGYATFFRHYRDKDALLKDVLDVVLDELMGLLQAPMQDTDHAAAGTLIFKYVKEHSEVVHVLLSSRESSSMMHRIIEAGVQSVFSQNIPSSEGSVPAEIAAYHLVTATISLIQWWLEHQMPYSPERMGLVYQDLIARPTHTAAFEQENEVERTT